MFCYVILVFDSREVFLKQKIHANTRQVYVFLNNISLICKKYILISVKHDKEEAVKRIEKYLIKAVEEARCVVRFNLARIADVNLHKKSRCFEITLSTQLFVARKKKLSRNIELGQVTR